MVRSGSHPQTSPARPKGGPQALPGSIGTPVAVLAVLGALLCATLAVIHAGQTRPSQADRWAYLAVDELMPGPGSAIHVIDFVGEPLGALLATGILAGLCWGLGRRRLAVVAVVSVAGIGVLSPTIKPLVGRTIHGSFLSYPSGHTAAAAALGLLLTLLLVTLLQIRKVLNVIVITVGASASALLMALDQVASGAHYLTDTVGGFGLALVVVPSTAYLIDRLADWPIRRHVARRL